MRAERARADDLPAVASVLCAARQYLAEQGLDQWQNFPPTREDTAAHFARGELYVVRDGDVVAGTFVVVPQEPAYDVIDGAWLQNGAYVAVHRVAMSPAYRRRGVTRVIFSEAEALARAAGARSVRIDTHAGNVPMRSALEHYGFTACGTVVIATGELRVGYEKEVV